MSQQKSTNQLGANTTQWMSDLSFTDSFVQDEGNSFAASTHIGLRMRVLL